MLFPGTTTGTVRSWKGTQCRGSEYTAVRVQARDDRAFHLRVLLYFYVPQILFLSLGR